MKQVHIVFDSNHEVVCVLTSKKFADEFIKDKDYTIETYSIG